MVNFYNLVLVASALSMATVNCRKLMGNGSASAASRVASIYRPLQVTTAQIIDKRNLSPLVESSNSSESELTPTSVIPEITTENKQKGSEKLDRRTFGIYYFKQVRVYGYLLECLNGILPHTQAIKQLCTGEFKGDPEKLSWTLVAKLRAILQALNACLAQIKDCGRAPAPSALPGGRVPSTSDICRILFKIMCEIRTCCMLIGSLCIKYSIVRQICNDTLIQITGCLSSITISLGGEVGNVFTGLGSLFGTIPRFFIGIQFGFHAIPSILGSSNAFFSFRAFF